MRRVLVLAGILASLCAIEPGAALAGEIDRDDFRHKRSLVPAAPRGPVVFEPDGPVFEHSLNGFADLRVLDPTGDQVAWRPLPTRRGAEPRAVAVLNSGQRGRFAVALLDLGERRTVRDRVTLDIPGREFVGRATVLGADRRQGPFTRLSVTGIYDVRGARPARSTVAAFPPSDFRYLLVRVSGVSRITGATVAGRTKQPRTVRREPQAISRDERGAETVLTVDFGFRNLPVDEIQIEAGAGNYERPVTIRASNDGDRFRLLAHARISRFAGSTSAPITIDAHHRYLRIEIENGDDEPLSGIEVSASSRSRALLVEGGHPRPYTVYYGNPREEPPSYEFGRIPARGLDLDNAVHGTLGRERENPSFQPPPDTRSFLARHPDFVTAALALVALALGAVGLLVLRSRG